MEKNICYALARKWANAKKIEASIIRRRNCWDFYKKGLEPNGWEPEAIIKPEKTTKKVSKNESVQKNTDKKSK
ncbi:MAG: hypothetical protein GF317_23425 [Candidatus Lokiarchaeota archaeon]|nr:hypothetical protein [Candidatus Lokiarchaeota archaeon]